uniref:Uncharacterized protein n=1 Tax=Ananas comosus var. bracteatus TaxID=296719 RepID=A0A6V7Q1H8_ANACO|nr:unnamed protein product [Ananas comosus var. bracteatus]
METFRHQRSPGSDRFLGLFSPAPAASGGGGVAGDELHEDEPRHRRLRWSRRRRRRRRAPPRPRSELRDPRGAGGGRSEAHGGDGVILGSVRPSESDLRRRSLRLRLSLSLCLHVPFVLRVGDPRGAEAEVRVLAIGHGREQDLPTVGAGEGSRATDEAEKGFRRARRRRRRRRGLQGEAEMLPPHEIVARAWGDGTPMMTSSVLEGVGRTLKGRDLRRVRNAVLRQTGFLDNV